MPFSRNHIFILMVLLAACTAEVVPTPTPQQPVVQQERTSTWGVVQRIAQAEQASAPTVLPRTEETLLVWTGADNNEARIYAQSETGIQRILALKAYHPFHVMLFDGGRNITMLWQDRFEDKDGSQLLVATYSVDAVAVQDILSISRQPIRRYSAALGANGIIRTVFSSSEGMRSHLYFNRVDLQGRPQQTHLLRHNGDYPALVADGGNNLHLYWIENNRDVYYGRLDDFEDPPVLTDIERIAQIELRTGDALEDFSVAFDEAYAHLFWNIRRVTGRHDVLYASGHVINGIYNEPRRLGILQQNIRVETSYNSALVYEADIAEVNFTAWANPLAGQHTTLPVAIQQDDWLGVVYFQNGDMIGYQDVVESGTLIGLPAISTERNRNLYLTWSEPTIQGYANLYMTTSKRDESP